MLFVLITLAVSVAAVVAVGLMAFVDVAFHPPQYSGAAPRESGRLRPGPGSETFAWFSSASERLTRGLIEVRKDAGAALRNAAIKYGAKEAADARACEPVDAGFCSHRTGVTPPEALEMADYLRKTQSAERVEQISRKAAENSRRAAALDRVAYADACVLCPLAGEDGTCLAAPVRPIQCRVHCALFGHDLKWAADGDCARAAADGAEDGLDKAMATEGLNDERYELNSALATALSDPEAAEHCSHGKNPFEQCAPYSVSTR